MAAVGMRRMAKDARRYDLYLPLYYNDGGTIPDVLFEDVERRLLGRFGGVTSQQRDFPLRGIWQGGTQLLRSSDRNDCAGLPAPRKCTLHRTAKTRTPSRFRAA